MPENWIYLGVAQMLFPDCHVIHCRRDPRDFVPFPATRRRFCKASHSVMIWGISLISIAITSGRWLTGRLRSTCQFSMVQYEESGRGPARPDAAHAGIPGIYRGRPLPELSRDAAIRCHGQPRSGAAADVSNRRSGGGKNYERHNSGVDGAA